MKTLLIFVALVLGVFIYSLSNFGKIATPICNNIIQQEGDPQAMKDAAQKSIDNNDQSFTTKYQPFLHQRKLLASAAVILDDGYLLDMSKDTMDRYTDTPLQHDHDYGYILFHRAQVLEQSGNFEGAWRAYRQYVNLVPDGPDFDVARTAAAKLVAAHGYSD
jgi:hypothetical protein